MIKTLRLKKRPKTKVIRYTDGAEGMIAWCEDFVYVPIYPIGSVLPVWTRLGALPKTPHPVSGKSYDLIWMNQKRILRDALIMEDGTLRYRLIILCWQRGEGKSLLACLIQLWKFFCWDRQQIMLGANSKDQVKFVHFDIMRDIIRNSPELYRVVGPKNIQEKEIRLKNSKGEVTSMIRSISSFSGIVSNISGFTFSEMFDMKNPKFYTQLYGSIRNIPNAMGVIDSTVSDKTHVLYKLYQNAIKGKSKAVYYSYRCSRDGNLDDYWNPNMTQEQLDDYKASFPFGEFERYFLNLWSAGVQQVFTQPMIDEMKYIGCDGELLNHSRMSALLHEKERFEQVIVDAKGKPFHDGVAETAEKINQIKARMRPITSIYTLCDRYGQPKMATMDDLNRLSDVFDTDWAILAGVDFGDPYAVRGLARTILTIYAKGLPKSKSTPYAEIMMGTAPQYLYCPLLVHRVDDHSLTTVKRLLEQAHEEFDGIDTFCSERYGAWDVSGWCEDRDIAFEPVFPSYDRKRDAFKELFHAAKEGRFKAPPTGVPGSKDDDILPEEFAVFQHDQGKRSFSSPEKFEKYGVQDDFVYATGWCFYGGRELGVDHFRPRRSVISFGQMYDNKTSLAGNYA